MNDAPTKSLDGGTHATTVPFAARLRTIYPPALRAIHPLATAPITLGRSPGEATVELPDATVSRRHAQIWWDAGHHAVRDLGSRHGTVIGTTALGAVASRLADGDVVRLGDVILVYEAGDVEPDGDGAEVDRDAVPGLAPAIAALRTRLARIAIDPAPALVIGETGTGKELIARELHRLSRRRGPLVAVNCATLTAPLAESQLFGHVKGAFTDAHVHRDGWFQQAEGGTLFLDELGELPLALQPKLLRVVQDRLVQPLGASRAAAIDVRICAATNRDLVDEVEHGRFRRDLYARLSKLELRVPSLGARRGDLLDWTERLWRTWFRERGTAAPPLAWKPAAARAIVNHPWRDNLRGVDRLVHDLAMRGDVPAVFDAPDLPAWLVAGVPAIDPSPLSTSHVGAARLPTPSRDEFVAVWTTVGGSVRAAARHFGRDRRQIYRWLETHGLRDPGTEDA